MDNTGNDINSNNITVSTQSTPSNTIMVKIAPLGGTVSDVSLTLGATVYDALKAAKKGPDNNDNIRLNNRECSTTDVLKDGDVITMVPRIRGGM